MWSQDLECLQILLQWWRSRIYPIPPLWQVFVVCLVRLTIAGNLFHDFHKFPGLCIHWLKTHTDFIWTNECQAEFDTLKAKLVSPNLVLQFPDMNKTFILKTDASDYCLGAQLSQMHDGERPLQYLSLHGAKPNWPTLEKGAYAIFSSCPTRL